MFSDLILKRTSLGCLYLLIGCIVNQHDQDRTKTTCLLFPFLSVFYLNSFQLSVCDRSLGY